MNPRNLSASDLVVWGIVLHLIADWPLQNDWMAQNKTRLLHPAGYFHASVHGLLLAIIFSWVAIPIAVVHFLIDTRKPIIWWGKLVGQTQPQENHISRGRAGDNQRFIPIWDAGLEVRIWVDQVFHIVCIAVAALLVAG